MEPISTEQRRFIDDTLTSFEKERIALLAEHKINSEYSRTRGEPSLRYVLLQASVLARFLNEFYLQFPEAQQTPSISNFTSQSNKPLFDVGPVLGAPTVNLVDSSPDATTIPVHIETV